ncbi:unnamed protein product [Closterium sp. NIES-65]|nr:unnamed protein product [Closterium sp. NIES-65]
MVTENGDIVWQPGPNKTAVVSNAKGKQLLHLPWDNEDLPPLPRTADAGALSFAGRGTSMRPKKRNNRKGQTKTERSFTILKYDYRLGTVSHLRQPKTERSTVTNGLQGAGEEKAEAAERTEPAVEAAVAPSAQAKEASGGQAQEKAEKEAREEEAVEKTRAEASPPEPDAKEGTKQAGQASKKKPVSPTARVLQADAAWGQRVWGSLISSWGRQSLMDEETDRN